MANSKISYPEGIAKLKRAQKNIERIDYQIDKISQDNMEGEYGKMIIFMEGETVGECTVIKMEITKGSPNDYLSQLKEERKKAYWKLVELTKIYQT